MRKGKAKEVRSWRVVYGVDTLSGVTFVRAIDEVAASNMVKRDIKTSTGLTPFVYYVTLDKRDP